MANSIVRLSVGVVYRHCLMFLLGVWWQHFHWRIGEASPWMAKQSIHGSDWQARFSAPLGNGERNEPLHTLEMDDSDQVVSVNRNKLELLEIAGINPLGQVHWIRFTHARTVAEFSCFPSGLRRSSEFLFRDGNGPSATGYLYYDAGGNMTGLDTNFGRARISQAYEATGITWLPGSRQQTKGEPDGTTSWPTMAKDGSLESTRRVAS